MKMLSMSWAKALFILFLLFGPLVYQKSVIVKSQTVGTINTQAVKKRIEASKSNVKPLPQPKEISKLLKLQNEVSEKNRLIKSTEKEIKEINKKLNTIGNKKRTLEAKLQELSLTATRNRKQIFLTQTNINRSQLKLEGLDKNITNSAEELIFLHNALIENYQRSNELDLSDKKISVLFSNSAFNIIKRIDEISGLTKILSEQSEKLEKVTEKLQEDKDRVSKEKSNLQFSKKELNDRQHLYDVSTAKQKRVVNETRNSESEYQKLLSSKLRERINLQQELLTYESQIEYIKNPKSLPKKQNGVLRWPVGSRPVITQGYGATAFARSRNSPYARPFHAGVDFGTHTGTKLYAVANGTIMGTGNTDLVRSCQLWGKWIVIKHDNGLTTLYAHLSLIKVRIGQKVSVGELIGYSGNTGQSTGPHLHFGLYASEGFRIIPYERFSSKGLCKGLLVPVASNNAKLNPLEYLPKI